MTVRLGFWKSAGGRKGGRPCGPCSMMHRSAQMDLAPKALQAAAPWWLAMAALIPTTAYGQNPARLQQNVSVNFLTGVARFNDQGFCGGYTWETRTSSTGTWKHRGDDHVGSFEPEDLYSRTFSKIRNPDYGAYRVRSALFSLQILSCRNLNQA